METNGYKSIGEDNQSCSTLGRKKDSSSSSARYCAYTVHTRDVYWIYQIRTFARSRNSFVREAYGSKAALNGLFSFIFQWARDSVVWREPSLPPAVPSHVLPIRVRETYNYSFERDRGRVCAVHTRDRNLDFSFDLLFSLVSCRSYDFIRILFSNRSFFSFSLKRYVHYFCIKLLNPFIA